MAQHTLVIHTCTRSRSRARARTHTHTHTIATPQDPTPRTNPTENAPCPPTPRRSLGNLRNIQGPAFLVRPLRRPSHRHGTGNCRVRFSPCNSGRLRTLKRPNSVGTWPTPQQPCQPVSCPPQPPCTRDSNHRRSGPASRRSGPSQPPSFPALVHVEVTGRGVRARAHTHTHTCLCSSRGGLRWQSDPLNLDPPGLVRASPYLPLE